MSFDVQIRKRVSGEKGARTFELNIAFNSAARCTVIYGPSGAGKSLSLQAIAGLLKPDSGLIVFKGQTFQDYALFPHLNVRQNIAFGLRRGVLNPSPKTDDDAVRHWLQAFELTEVAGQQPHQLSGGQRQRTAFARALVNGPQALLLDEPFSALDPALRERMRDELHRLLDRIGIPMLMITHDPDDLVRFGDARLLLQDGVISPPP